MRKPQGTWQLQDRILFVNRLDIAMTFVKAGGIVQAVLQEHKTKELLNINVPRQEAHC